MSIMEQDWENVEVLIVYLDRGNKQVRKVTFNRAEIEAQENSRLEEIHDAQDGDFEPHMLDQATFKRHIMQGVEKVSTSCLQVEDPDHNAFGFRVLPPWAIQEVQIVVNNLHSSIVTS